MLLEIMIIFHTKLKIDVNVIESINHASNNKDFNTAYKRRNRSKRMSKKALLYDSNYTK